MCFVQCVTHRYICRCLLHAWKQMVGKMVVSVSHAVGVNVLAWPRLVLVTDCMSGVEAPCMLDASVVCSASINKASWHAAAMQGPSGGEQDVQNQGQCHSTLAGLHWSMHAQAVMQQQCIHCRVPWQGGAAVGVCSSITWAPFAVPGETALMPQTQLHFWQGSSCRGRLR